MHTWLAIIFRNNNYSSLIVPRRSTLHDLNSAFAQINYTKKTKCVAYKKTFCVTQKNFVTMSELKTMIRTNEKAVHEHLESSDPPPRQIRLTSKISRGLPCPQIHLWQEFTINFSRNMSHQTVEKFPISQCCRILQTIPRSGRIRRWMPSKIYSFLPRPQWSW